MLFNNIGEDDIKIKLYQNSLKDGKSVITEDSSTEEYEALLSSFRKILIKAFENSRLKAGDDIFSRFRDNGCVELDFITKKVFTDFFPENDEILKEFGRRGLVFSYSHRCNHLVLTENSLNPNIKKMMFSSIEIEEIALNTAIEPKLKTEKLVVIELSEKILRQIEFASCLTSRFDSSSSNILYSMIYFLCEKERNDHAIAEIVSKLNNLSQAGAEDSRITRPNNEEDLLIDSISFLSAIRAGDMETVYNLKIHKGILRLYTSIS